MKAKKHLATVMAATMVVSGSVVSVNAATSEDKIVGSNRTDTAVKISKDGWASAETVILVNDSAIPDALTATPLAHAKKAPILLTGKGGLNKATADEIKRLGAKNVIMIGGDAVLPAKVEKALKDLKVKTDRVKGATREETALAIAKRLDGIKDVSEIAVVNGTTGLADAVSVAAAAAEKGMPIILANPKKGLSVAEKFIKAESIKASFVIGGKTALPKKLVSNLPGKQRVEGSNRNDTNAKVIEKFYGDKELDNLYLAKDGRGGDSQLIDALAVGALAAKNGDPVLIASKKLNATQVNVINTKKVTTITQVGGKGNEGAFKHLKDIEKAEIIKVKSEAELQEALKKANANDIIEIEESVKISKDITLSTNNAIQINVRGELKGEVTVKTPNADIKNSGTIGTLVVENGKNTTIKNTSAGKISKVEISSSSSNVKLENDGKITNVENNANGTEIENYGTISNPVTGAVKPEVDGNKPGSGSNKPIWPSVDQDKVALVKFVQDATKYEYKGGGNVKPYKYTGEIRVTGTESANVEIAGPYESINLGDEKVDGKDPKKAAMDDMARYLGALYRLDLGKTIEAIEYEGKTYKWNIGDKELKGSNWRENGAKNGQTLVNKIVLDFRNGNHKLGNPINLTLVGSNKKEVSVRINFKQEFPVEANGKGYATLQEAINANGEVTLLKDVTVDKKINLNSGAKTTINLNGNKLTSTYTDDKAFDIVGGGKELVLQNGDLVTTSTGTSVSCIKVEKGGKLTLDKVNYNVETGTGIFVAGDAASVNVINNSIISAKGYCVSTNAGDTNNYNVIVLLQNSIFKASKEGTPILVNVPSTVKIEKCKVYGNLQGVVVRGGTAEIINTVIENTTNGKNKYFGETWDSGNGVPNAALVIGNNNESAYKYPAKVTLTGGSIKQNDASDSPIAIYMHGNKTENNGAYLTYDENNQNITGSVVVGNDKCFINNQSVNPTK